MLHRPLHDNHVKRGVLRGPLRQAALHNCDVQTALSGQIRLSLSGHSFIFFNRDNSFRKFANHCRGIAKTATNIQYQLIALNIHSIKHLGKGARFKDHAAMAQVQNRIRISGFIQVIWHENLPPHLKHGVNNGKFRHISRSNLCINHRCAACQKIGHVRYSCRHRVSQLSHMRQCPATTRTAIRQNLRWISRSY